MLNLLKKSWLHFLILGCGLYILQLVLPPPVQWLEPPSAKKITELREQWLRHTGRPASKAQLQNLIKNEINQEILFREALRRGWHLSDTVVRQHLLRNIRFIATEGEQADEVLIKIALAMKLHENDLVVRRRLIQRMEMLAYAPLQEAQAPDGLLERRFREQAMQLMHPALVDFQHLFVSRDRHTNAPARAAILLQTLSATPAAGEQISADPFLLGLMFFSRSEKQVMADFGSEFAHDLFKLCMPLDESTAPLQRWLGPISSNYGEHLVRLSQCQPATGKTFAEVKKQLLLQWRLEQKKLALQVLIEQLRVQYQLTHSPVEAVDD